MLSVAGAGPSQKQAGQGRAGEPLELPQESELLHEQLDYLIDHARACNQDCPVCRRFSIAREAMMQVWR